MVLNNVVMLEANDDEAEKQLRKERRKSLAAASPGKLKPARKSIGGRKNVTQQYIAELYSNSMKLINENKINSKNAFEVRFLDHIDALVAATDDNDETNFQKASCTIEASAKIYGYRVDSVHTEAYKVLGGLSRADVREEDTATGIASDDDNDVADEDGENTNVQKKKKRAKKGAQGESSTLEKNPDNLNLNKFDLEFEVDPLFHKTSARFDEGGVKGLLLNSLRIDSELNWMLDSTHVAADDSTDLEEEVPQPVVCDTNMLLGKLKSYLKDFKSLYSMEISPELTLFKKQMAQQHAFSTDEPIEKPIAINVDASLTSSSAVDDDRSHLECDSTPIESTMEPTNDEFVHDLDVSDADSDDYGGDADHFNEPFEQRSESVRDGTSLEARLACLGDGSGDYGFFDPNLLKNWSGPNHWKFRGAAVTKGSAEVLDKKAQRKSKAASFALDFSSSGKIDLKAAFKVPKKGFTNTFTATQLEKHTLQTTTLPDDIGFTVNEFTRLFTRPRLMIKLKRVSGLQSNSSDSQSNQEFVPVLVETVAAMDSDDEDDAIGTADNIFTDTADFGDMFVVNSTSEVGSLQLLQQPKTVEKIEINYAKVAKKVDVKALKENMWSSLSGTLCNGDEEKDTKLAVQKSDPVAKKDTGSFQTVMSKLPQQMVSEDLENISVHFCFVCVLHLANENGLRFDNSENPFGDFQIIKEFD
eukprot:GILJ01008725.1.p1 GENE.GILJ01008725.1~~GILJ01008725.1.p1  ORF type:complete len:700 (+),score=180.43 GILJ01008725.1:61-2160(+)